MDNHITNHDHIRSCRSRAGSTVTVFAMALGILTPAAVLAGPVEDVENHCLSGTPRTADSRERWAGACRASADVSEAAYHDCMYDAPGTADSLERWVDLCAADLFEARELVNLGLVPKQALEPLVDEDARLRELVNLGLVPKQALEPLVDEDARLRELVNLGLVPKQALEPLVDEDARLRELVVTSD